MVLSNSIKNWAEDERPREKMLQKGAVSLSDAELLAILISSGTKEKSALDLAREVLGHAHNNLHELGRLGVVELQKTKGIGEARAITIAAALELGRRRQITEGLQRPTITQSADAAEIVIPLLRDLNHEMFCVLYLNQSSRVLRHEMISSGGLTGTVADIRMILKNALLYNANKLIIAHNHPSGNQQPSLADKELTKKLKEAAEWMDIKLLDHLIVAGTSYLSMADEGII
ncbi:RadC family protein [Polluticoccus soli]|uniref:RadC family protein n=1 Tax=Polluticoccus soli TaxID=3034150 RepID=UPI0023E213F1|nr:DNA repair protein RadC [Flavipsychrobacter sp. JY13-12]